ncbi:hypothetical protein MAR_025243 [Mya arenaria]|uniref:Uncharacterized protein n=1 Tax=Mya arenaria TaxID=6604 RepID=A0ABY7DX35_MYAAR|nr:hypothetical protein MAR_025243 [Mya arenaria]
MGVTMATYLEKVRAERAWSRTFTAHSTLFTLTNRLLHRLTLTLFLPSSVRVEAWSLSFCGLSVSGFLGLFSGLSVSGFWGPFSGLSVLGFWGLFQGMTVRGWRLLLPTTTHLNSTFKVTGNKEVTCRKQLQKLLAVPTYVSMLVSQGADLVLVGDSRPFRSGRLRCRGLKGEEFSSLLKGDRQATMKDVTLHLQEELIPETHKYKHIRRLMRLSYRLAGAVNEAEAEVVFLQQVELLKCTSETVLLVVPAKNISGHNSTMSSHSKTMVYHKN